MLPTWKVLQCSHVRTVPVNCVIVCSSAGFVSNAGQGLSYVSVRVGACVWNAGSYRIMPCYYEPAISARLLYMRTKVFYHKKKQQNCGKTTIVQIAVILLVASYVSSTYSPESDRVVPTNSETSRNFTYKSHTSIQ